MKFYISKYEGGSCIQFSKTNFGDKFLEIDDRWNFVIINNNKIFLAYPIIEKIKYRYNFGGFRGPQNVPANKYTFNVNGKNMIVYELDKWNNGEYKIEHIEYNNEEYREK